MDQDYVDSLMVVSHCLAVDSGDFRKHLNSLAAQMMVEVSHSPPGGEK